MDFFDLKIRLSTIEEIVEKLDGVRITLSSLNSRSFVKRNVRINFFHNMEVEFTYHHLVVFCNFLGTWNRCPSKSLVWDFDESNDTTVIRLETEKINNFFINGFCVLSQKPLNGHVNVPVMVENEFWWLSGDPKPPKGRAD